MLEAFHLVGIEVVLLVEAVLPQSHLVLFVFEFGGLEPVVEGILNADVNGFVSVVVAHVRQAEDLGVEVEPLRPLLEQGQVVVEIGESEFLVVDVVSEGSFVDEVDQTQLVDFFLLLGVALSVL